MQGGVEFSDEEEYNLRDNCAQFLGPDRYYKEYQKCVDRYPRRKFASKFTMHLVEVVLRMLCNVDQ